MCFPTSLDVFQLWQARADKWQREQRARDRLMQEVIAGRKEQLEHALNQNRVRLHEAQLEKHALEAEIAQQHHQEELSRAEHLQEARDYKAALVDQVAVSREKRRDAQMLEMELGQAARDEEVRYRELLAREVDRAHNLPR
ncbi:hypothetical protein HKX48_006243 [Thoreauomyces humboldtii]|nr:hypothetical protein HKX48_006243 [Thoreauomyces humboldtii]